MFRPTGGGWRFARSLAVSGLAVILSIACGGSGSSNSTPAAGQKVALNISYSELVPDELGPWGAADGGFFAKNNLDVTLISIASTNGIAALLSGQVQFAQLGGSEVVSAGAAGADIVILGNLVPVYPYVFMTAKDITTFAQLKGKKVGVSKFGGSADIATRVALAKQGMDPTKDVTIIETGSASNRVAALRAGNIQGAVSQPPESTNLKKDGFNVIYDMAAQKLPAANTVIASRRSYVKEHQDVVQRYVDSLVQALARVKKDQAFVSDVLVHWEKLSDTSTIPDTYNFYAQEVLVTYPIPLAEQYQDAIAVLGQKDPKVKGYDVNKILDPSFAKSAQQRKVGG